MSAPILIIKFKMLNKIQNQLIKQYPQLEQKTNILEYYMSLQYPEKQRKLISWWEEMIEAAVRKSGEIYLSPADLEIIFSLHGLKPVPLLKVLQYLEETKKIEWEGRQKQDIRQQNSGGGWLGSITSYIWKSGNQNVAKSGFKSLQLDQNTKIMPLKYKNQLVSQIKSVIEKQLEHQKSISYDYIFAKLKRELNISESAIQYLLEDLERRNWFVSDMVQNKRILFHTIDQKQLRDKKWIEIQKSKFVLKSTLQIFEKKIDQRMKQQSQKLQQAKNSVAENDQNRAKRVLGQVRAMKKTTDQLQNRRKLLRQTLDSLQLNQLDSTTIDVVGQCQKIIQKTMVDAEQVQAIKQKHLQIAISQKQLNDQMQQMRNMDSAQIEDQVDNMMAQLQQQIKKKKKQKLIEEEMQRPKQKVQLRQKQVIQH